MAVEQRWREILDGANDLRPAINLYQGRAFSIARNAAQRSGADLSIVSAGLGWVRSQANVPNYDLTVSRSSLASYISGSFDRDAWWRSVVTGPFSTSPAEDLKIRPVILACVSQDYASFFTAELEHVPVGSLRIFGSGLEKKLSANLGKAVMPYDERLSRLSSGTRADFAQRALAHYLFALSPTGVLDEDAASVRAAMAGLPPINASPVRRQLSDAELRAIIRTLVPQIGSRSRMLRHIRDTYGVACEQSRFARLYSEADGT